MALTRAQTNRMIRREAMREQLSVLCHYRHFVDSLEKMKELAGGEVNQDTKDRFAMFSVLADKHWRVIEKYLPPLRNETPAPHAELSVVASGGVSKVEETVRRLLEDRIANA